MLALLAPLVLTAWPSESRAAQFPGPEPGQATAARHGRNFQLANCVLSCDWTLADGRLRPVAVMNRLAGTSLDLGGNEVFRLALADGRSAAASQLRLLDKPTMARLRGRRSASILGERFPGRAWTLRLGSDDGNLEVTWRAVLRDGANAIRQEVSFISRSQSLAVNEATLVDLPLSGAKPVGSVPGSPLVAGDLFFAVEHPDATNRLAERVTGSLALNTRLRPGQPVVLSSVVGVVPAGQLRRGFLHYVEWERAHPYRPFLHYNAWYDLCWGDRKIRQDECLRVIDHFGRELIQGRGVPLASFVWDDGWDDPQTLWQPVPANFPNGFDPVLTAARRYRSTLGFWLSPFGGYGKPKEDRIAMGRAQGFETGPQGFSLAGPQYHARFRDTCLRFIEQDGANFFKFDGLARHLDETEAMLRLTRTLRARRADLFISITTGTWPSPFWLWYGDSTWRGGGDMGFHGDGSKREQWITYRDLETYRNVVQAAPLYPLNSLMTQGFAHARYGTAAEVGSDDAEIRRELRSFFASGTCLQELYVTPEKMSSRNWNDLAESAKWAHANAEVLVDTHWIGGDPGRGEPYGWAAWSPRKGILAFRNPAAHPAMFRVDIGPAFELPARAPQRYALRSPWKDDAGRPAIQAEAGTPRVFELEPFAVVVFDAVPIDRSRRE